MKGKKTIRLLIKTFHVTGTHKVLCIFMIYFVIVAFILQFVEPNIKDFADSMWYCFAVATTIGFGDIAAVSIVGRTLTIILSVYSIVVVAIFTAVITSFFLEQAKIRNKDKIEELMDQLEHLSDLSKEELDAISEKVKEFRES